MSYRAFFSQHGGTIAAGFLLALLSSFGQTFFISLSGPALRAEFELSNSAFGSIYSIATLTSGLLLIWAGAKLDDVPLRRFAGVALGGLAIAALGLSLVPSLVFLGLAFFGLRFFGQGLLSHAAVTSVARLPAGVRGRAVALACLGFSAGEALLPAAGLWLLSALQWRASWQVVAAVLGLALCLHLLLGRRLRAARPAGLLPAATPGQVLRRRDLFLDRRFLLLIPSIMAPGAVVTGFFFYQPVISQTKGWPPELVAGCFTLYALVSVGSSIAAGLLVDRLRALPLTRFYLLPLGAAGLALATLDGLFAVPVFFACIGMTAGATNVVMPATLAELFGVTRLATVKALASALGVVASATTPVLWGLLLDAGVDFAAIGIGALAYMAAASLLNLTLPARRHPEAASPKASLP